MRCVCISKVAGASVCAPCRFASNLGLIIVHRFENNSSELAQVDLTKLATLVRGLYKIRYDRVKIVRDAALEAFSSFQQMNLAYLDGGSLPSSWAECDVQQQEEECSNVLRPRSLQDVVELKAAHSE